MSKGISILKANLIANYASQLYVTLVGFAFVPLYVKYLGAEAYGLVGFFATLQALFNLLDLGLSATIARETARYHGGAITDLDYRRLFRVLSLIFFTIALFAGVLLFMFSDVITDHWLNVESLSREDVLLAVKVMAVSVSLRWMSGLYRGVLTGAEKLVWLSGFNALITSLRFIGVFGSMWLWGYSPEIFFIHQLIVAIFEFAGLLIASRALLPSLVGTKVSIGFSFYALRNRVNFALSIAFTSAVWTLVTQADKLILSGILPLSDYGYFTLAVLVAGGILVITGPISGVLLPRMSRLHAENRNEELINLYRRATQWVSLIAVSGVVTLFVCAESLLIAWSGNVELSANAAPILKLYAIGNGFLAIAAFPYYLQYARGNLHYHLVGNIVMLFVLIPIMVFVATYYGAIGAGWVWLGVNGLYLLTWLAYVHQKLEPGLHWKWLRQDVVAISLPAVGVGIFATFIHIPLTNRFEMLLYTAAIGAMTMAATALFSQSVRNKILNHG